MRTVEEVRRLRLEQLRERYGTWAALNEKLKLGARDSTFSQIMSAKTKKEMGSDLARRLERIIGLEVGWMDTDPEFDDQQWPFGPDISPGAVARLPDNLMSEARGMLRLLLKQADAKPSPVEQGAATLAPTPPPAPNLGAQRSKYRLQGIKPKAGDPVQTRPGVVPRES